MTEKMARPTLTFDEMLADGGPAEELVPLCLNGKLVRQYEEVSLRIAARALDADHNRQVQVRDGGDDRLGGPEPEPVAEPVRDPEQDEADRLIAEMKRFTQVFRLTSIGDRFPQLMLEHPPRPDPLNSRQMHPRDTNGFNMATLPAALVRLSIAEPEMTDARWEKLMRGKACISDAQFERLWEAASRVNRADADLPFSLDDLGTPPR